MRCYAQRQPLSAVHSGRGQDVFGEAEDFMITSGRESVAGDGFWVVPYGNICQEDA